MAFLKSIFGSAAVCAAAMAGTPRFDAEILPLLKSKCAACHGAKSPQGKLRLDTHEGVLAGGATGPAITVGNSARSLLIDKIVTRQMPPGKQKLSDAEVDLLRVWIDQGAPKDPVSGAVKVASELTEHDVMPIFQIRCVACHGKREQRGGLDLRTLASRLKGGTSGPALVPGKPEESLIIQKIESGAMPPPKLQLEYAVRNPTAAEVAKLKQWIADGAPAGEPRPKADVTENDPVVKDRDRTFWSFLPPKRPAVPTVKNQKQVRNPIDAFLLAKLESKNLRYSEEASKEKLLRRAYLDLTGMPPTPAETAEYLNDARPDAYERLIDRLLGSTHYGERWGRYWLDLAGYADSEGFGQHDGVRQFGWRYRDYVIRAFNADKPYSEFLTEQLAGDELVDYRNLKVADQTTIDRLAATGFLRQTPDQTDAPERGFLPERMNIIADEVEVLGSAVMGLTINCARCHNHKYDPIPQRDYYRFGAILGTSFDPYDWLPPRKRVLKLGLATEWKDYETANAPHQAEIERLKRRLEEIAKPYRDAHPEAKGKDVEALVNGTPELRMKAEAPLKQLGELKGKLKPEPAVRVLTDTGGDPSGSYILRRGDAIQLAESVEPGVPSVLKVGLTPYRIEKPPIGIDTSGRRLALARWLTQSNHPLTARVMVNHVWLRHFGRGIVPTPSNFGRSGMPPTHPELLDWLATEFVESGWSIKQLHRLMMTSTAYRQSSRVTEAVTAADPENALLSRMPLRRLDAEALYDSILRATGRLDPRPYGEPEATEVKADKEVVAKGGKSGFRRSVYVLHRRQAVMTLFDSFDFPAMTPNCIERRQSTVATQALQLMNGTLPWEHAKYMAGRIIDEAGEDRRRQVELLYARALSRKPASAELEANLGALGEFEKLWPERLKKDNPEAPVAYTAKWMALTNLCHTILNSAEFSYVD